jgi:hypothetical protein
MPAKEVTFVITTSSQQINFPWPNTPGQYPTITMNGAAFPAPAYGGNAPTGWLVVILDQTKDLTTPAAILFNQYVFVIPSGSSNSWMSTYQYTYGRMVRGLLTSGSPGSQLLIAASFGFDNNMPPTNDGFAAFLDYGAGPQLQKWATHCDTGSQVGNNTSWTSFPASYILAGANSMSYGQGYETYNFQPGPTSLTATFQTFGD